MTGLSHRTLRLAVLGDSPCDLCTAACCKQNGHAYAVLLEGDECRRFRPWSISVPIEHDGRLTTERVIPYVEGRCPFLGADDRCTIYADRPANCRRFQCVTGYRPAGTHSRFLQLNAGVLALLESLRAGAP